MKYTEKAEMLSTKLIEKFKKLRGEDDAELKEMLHNINIETRKMEVDMYRKSREVFPDMVQDLKETTFNLKALIKEKRERKEDSVKKLALYIFIIFHPIKAFSAWRDAKWLARNYFKLRQRVLRTYGFLIRMDQKPEDYHIDNIPRFKGEFDWYVNLIKQGKTCIDE